MLRLVLFFSIFLLIILLLSWGIYGSFLFTFSIPVIWQMLIKKKGLSSLGIKTKFLFFSSIFGVVSGVILGLLIVFILEFLGIRGNPLTGKEEILGFSIKRELGYRLLTDNLFLYFLYCIFPVGLGEELFWRGFIQQKMKNYFKKKTSIWLTAFLFSLVHFYIFLIAPLYIAALFLVSIIFLGVFWGYSFEKFENLFFPALSHGILAFIVWVYYYSSFTLLPL